LVAGSLPNAEDDVGGMYGTDRRDETFHTGLVEKHEDKGPFGRPRLRLKIKLERILKK
jgi:hypothetical protein